MEYAGFWKRLQALVVDTLVISPLIVASFWASSRTRDVYRIFIILNFFVVNAYQIVCIACWGQTIGKWASGIRVVQLSGEPASWREAILRNTVDFLLSLASNASTWIALGILSEIDWSQDSHEKWRRIDALRPAWAKSIDYVWYSWILGELVVLLFNRKRRALHDFIAGTVVVRRASLVMNRVGIP